jgi:hypothetical protein
LADLSDLDNIVSNENKVKALRNFCVFQDPKYILTIIEQEGIRSILRASSGGSFYQKKGHFWMKLSNFYHQVKAIIKNILFSFLEPIKEKVVELENPDLINAVNKITITINKN